MKLINNFIVNVQNKFFDNHRSIACKGNVFFLIRAREQRARIEARSVLSVKRFYLIKYCFNQLHFSPKTFSNDRMSKKIYWFPTTADKLINNKFFENYMILYLLSWISQYFLFNVFLKKKIFASVWTVDNTSTRFRAERSLFDRCAQLLLIFTCFNFFSLLP